jgi:chemotaxis protein MotB
MARRRKHEDHQNHEAWAIPYGDLITLLLAFFVVMYAISSVNEGKFRVLSDSMQAAFRGSPTTLDPVKVGDKPRGTTNNQPTTKDDKSTDPERPKQLMETVSIKQPDAKPKIEVVVPPELAKVADEVEASLSTLVEAQLVTVRRHSFWIEVEIRTDILFASGIAKISAAAIPTLDALAKTLAPYPNAIRVEGHTDNKPIKTSIYPSNWELSSARAASVVHLLANGGVGPKRLSVIGLGEWHPAQSNDTLEGRNANRRVLLIILSGAAEDAPNGQPMVLPDANPQEPPQNGVTVAPVQPLAVPGEHAAPISTPLATATGSALPPVVTPATH